MQSSILRDYYYTTSTVYPVCADDDAALFEADESRVMYIGIVYQIE